jgi:hypothetical protein
VGIRSICNGSDVGRSTSSNSGLRAQFSKEDEDSDWLPSGDLITAGPYDPKMGKLREGWAERITRLRERLEGMKKQMTGAKQIAQLAGRLRNQ